MPRTSVTGNTTPGSKSLIRYDVGTLPTDIQEQFDTTTTGSTVLMTVDWSESADFLRDMLGYAEKDGTQLRRILPEYSYWDDDTYAVACRSVQFIGGTTNDPDLGDWPVPAVAVYAVTFATPLYKVKEDDEVTHEHERYCVWRANGVAQNEKIPGGGFKFVSGTASERTPLNEVGVKTGRLLNLTCKWIDVPFVDYPKLSTLANKVNDAEVTWNGVAYPTGTVLFTGWDLEPRNNHFGDPTHDINLSFSIRTDGRTWNSFWKNGTDGYVEVSSDGTSGGDKPFTAADLNDIWTFTS